MGDSLPLISSPPLWLYTKKCHCQIGLSPVEPGLPLMPVRISLASLKLQKLISLTEPLPRRHTWWLWRRRHIQNPITTYTLVLFISFFSCARRVFISINKTAHDYIWFVISDNLINRYVWPKQDIWTLPVNEGETSNSSLYRPFFKRREVKQKAVVIASPPH